MLVDFLNHSSEFRSCILQNIYKRLTNANLIYGRRFCKKWVVLKHKKHFHSVHVCFILYVIKKNRFKQ